MTAALLVGGDRAFVTMMRIALEDEGYAVSDVATGEMAVSQLRHRTDAAIVLLLTTNPYANGLAVLEAAEAEMAVRRHPLVLVTGEFNALPAGWDELVEVLSIPVVAKPFRLDLLLHTLRDACARLRAEQAGTAMSGAI
jgi:DNA-binding response OmpR family regulator